MRSIGLACGARCGTRETLCAQRIYYLGQDLLCSIPDDPRSKLRTDTQLLGSAPLPELFVYLDGTVLRNVFRVKL